MFLVRTSLDEPVWAVCALAIIWLYFPTFQQSAQALSRRICFRYYLQTFYLLVVVVGLLPILGIWPAFAEATMQPFGRLPVFLMGRHYTQANCLYAVQNVLTLGKNALFASFLYEVRIVAAAELLLIRSSVTKSAPIMSVASILRPDHNA